MKKVHAIVAISLTVLIIIAVCLSVIAITGGTALQGNKESITLDKARYILFLDGDKTVSPIVSTDLKHKEYTLQSSNPTIFTIGEDGVIKGLKEGIAQLIISSKEIRKTVTVIVYTSQDSPLIPSQEDGKLLVVFATEQSAVPSQRVYPGEYIQDPGTPPNVPDQVVEGWYTDKDFTHRYDFSAPITTDITLYAKWTAGDNPTFDFKTLVNGSYSIEKLKYPQVAFLTLSLPSADKDGKALTVINSNAFQDYTYVETVIIPKGIKVIKDYAFAGCTNLKTVIFEEESELTIIEAEAFWKCTSLDTIVLPAGVTSIGRGAFNACTNLETINLPDGISELTQQVFAGTGITSIDLNNITKLMAKAFYGAAKLSTVSNPVKLTSVEAEAFVGTKWLTDAYNANGGIAYLGTVLISCKTVGFIDITIRPDTTLIANNALFNISNCIIRMNTATPPIRGYSATNTDGNQNLNITTNKVNIVVPKEYYNNYKTDSTWGSICKNQIYYSLIVTVPNSSSTIEFFVRELGDDSNKITSAVLNKYTGSDTALDISAIMASTQELGEQAYLERIRKDTFTDINALVMTTVTLPLRTGAIEQYAFNVRELKTIWFAGYTNATDKPSDIKLETNFCFGTRFNSNNSDTHKIYVPQSYFTEYNKTTAPLVPIWSSANIKNNLVAY